MSRAASDRIADIVESISRIYQALAALEAVEEEPDSPQSEMYFDAILYRLVVIGEAVKALPDSWKTSEPGIPWAEISKLRDPIVHHYHRISAEVIRQTVATPLTDLNHAMGRLATAADLLPEAGTDQ